MQQQTLEKRVGILESKMESLEGLPDRVAGLELQVSQFRAEVRVEFSATRTELRQEMRTLNGETRVEMHALNDETRVVRASSANCLAERSTPVASGRW